jgi:hypothetical protein
MTSIRLALDAIRPQFDGDVLSEIVCPDCEGHTIIHQPDEALPDRLLATCPSCTAWFLLHAAAGVMVRLPEEGALRSD